MTEELAITEKGKALIAAMDAHLVDPHGDLQQFEDFWRLYAGHKATNEIKKGNTMRTPEFWKEIRGWIALSIAVIALIVAILT